MPLSSPMPPTVSKPSLRALLSRDYPARTYGIFALLFALGAVGIGALIILTSPEETDAAIGVASVLSVFAIGAGLASARRLRWIAGLTQRGVVVDGVVYRNEPNSEEVYFIEVEYDWEGTAYRVSKGTGMKSRFAPGDTVRVLVDPARPAKGWIAE